MKSWFKTKTAKDQDILKLQAQIEQANTDINEYRNLVNFVNIYHGALAIDRFKKDKAGQYTRMLNFMSVREIHNAYHSATINHRILEL